MKKRFAALDATVIILSAACIALCVALALVKPTYLVLSRVCCSLWASWSG